MPRDTQIPLTAPGPAPYDYPIPANVELILRQVHATFDGSGAASSFLPCVDLISDSGHTIARCVDPSVSIAAGASAGVSWFPRVKPAGGSSSTTTAEWFYVNRSSSLTMPAGGQDTIPWSSLVTSDSSLFSLATNNHANDSVQVSRQGLLVVSTYLIPTAIGTDFVLGVNNNLVGFGVIGEGTQTPEVQFDRDGLPSGVTKFGPRDISLMVMSQVPQLISPRFHNFDAANRAITFAQMAGAWFPTSTLIT